MKVLLSWLRDYIDIEHSAEDVAEILSNLGLPNEGIEYFSAPSSPDGSAEAGDAAIDVEVTSNRGDCLGYIGIARELAAATDKEIKVPQINLVESGKTAAELAEVEIIEPVLCGRYTARVIDGIKVGPSPDWLKGRLEAIGMRSVNNVVDATNYAMLETGQPPHAFDYAKITGGKIIVRKASAGEQIVSIDGSKCELTTDMLIIADAKRPVAIAGVMGGLDTEVSEATTTILLEDAFFDPVSVRTTARNLGLVSEASFRFGRIVDIENINWASQRTAQLIIQAAGGKAAKGVVDVYPARPKPKEATLRLGRLKKLLGIDVPKDEVMRILGKLGFEPKRDGEKITCSIPSRRNDVYREADLIEEVARVYGYGKVPMEKTISIEVAPIDTSKQTIDTIGTYLNGCGFYETVTISFVDAGIAELFAEPGQMQPLSVKDVNRKDTNLLRQSILPSLLGVMKSNHNAGNTPCRIFEIADTYIPTGDAGQLPVERSRLGLVCDSDLRDIRGVVEGLLRSIAGESVVIFEPGEIVWAQAGARITVKGETLGSVGVLSQELLDKLDFKNFTICGAELDLERLLSLRRGPVKVKPIPRFPAIRRDLSLVLDDNISWSQIESAVKSKAPAELENIEFVDIFRGKGIPAGKKSVTLSLSFRDNDGTLTHEAVDKFESTIVSELATSVGAVLRTA